MRQVNVLNQTNISLPSGHILLPDIFFRTGVEQQSVFGLSQCSRLRLW